MAEDKYLDHSRVLRELEEAEKACHLDAQGVLDQLAEAIKHCDKQAESHTKAAEAHVSAADAYMLAKAAYWAEVRRRTVLTRSEVGRRCAAARYGTLDPVTTEGFEAFCARVGVNYSHARRLSAIGDAPSPLGALVKQRMGVRDKERKRLRATKAVVTVLGLPSGAGSHYTDPLRRCKIEFHKLSTEQRRAFLAWVNETYTPQAKRSHAATQQEARV